MLSVSYIHDAVKLVVDREGLVLVCPQHVERFQLTIAELTEQSL